MLLDPVCHFTSLRARPSLGGQVTLLESRPVSCSHPCWCCVAEHLGIQLSDPPYPQPVSLSTALLSAQLLVLGSMLASMSENNQLSILNVRPDPDGSAVDPDGSLQRAMTVTLLISPC